MSPSIHRVASLAVALLSLAACGGSSDPEPQAECSVPADCGADTECRTFACSSGTCSPSDATAGTVLAVQVPGDCRLDQCDGAGAVVSVGADGDLPDDGNPCTSDTCSGGAPSFTPVAPDTGCAQDGGSFCDGAGACVACTAADQCPGLDDECRVRTCISNACGVTFTGAGTPVASQTPGDCQENQCDGAGSVVSNDLNSDLPDDGNQCTTDTCSGGSPSFTPVAPDTACNQNGGAFCDAVGACVQCNAASQCPGSDNECQVRSCMSGACGVDFFGAGFLVSTQTPGDCQQNECDGAGAIVSVALNTDAPADDGLQCTTDTCSAGAPVHPPVATGTTCTQDGGTVCNGSGACVQCNLASQCPGITDACQAPACSAGACGTLYAAAGTVCLGSGTCDGAGVCTLPPSVTATSPADGAAATVPAPIAVTFSTSMSPATLTGQTAFGPCSGSIQLSADNFTSCWPFASAGPTMTGGNVVATLLPSPGLLANREYKLRVTTAATSAAGLPLAASYTSATGFFAQVPAAPGAAINESGDPLEMDYCTVQFPVGFSVQQGTPAQMIFGRVYEATFTEPPGQSLAVWAQLGFGPPTANPEYGSGWTWGSASYNVQVGNDDEYMGNFTAPPVGSYRYAFRFSRDIGQTWTYCDLTGAGSNAGLTFDLTELPVMTVTP